MSNKSTSASYVGVGYNFTNKPYLSGSRLTCEEDIKEENLLRIVSDTVIGDFVISARLVGQSTEVPIFVGTGSIDTAIDISLYDRMYINASSNLTSGTLSVSAFFTPGDVTMTILGGNATAANQVIGNSLLTQILTQLQQDVDCAETVAVINQTVIPSSIYSIVLPLDCKKFSIRHRDKGDVELSFEPTLSSFFTIPKGCSLAEDQLCLSSSTLYIRSSKAGVIEILAYS